MATAPEELVAAVKALLGRQVLDSHTHRGDATVLVPVDKLTDTRLHHVRNSYER